MGYYILHSKNTKLCVRNTRHRVERVQMEVNAGACVGMRTATIESVATDHLELKVLALFTARVKGNYYTRILNEGKMQNKITIR